MAEKIVVTKDERKYKTLITDIGNEKIAKAALIGEKVDVVTAVVTDGGGQYFVPTADMTELPNEVWRGAIASKEINAASQNMIDVRIFLDGTVGGFTARGIGLFDADGDLIAVCNMPDTEKAVIVDGIAATLTLIMHIVVTHVDALDFKIDPSVDTISSAELEAAIQKNNDQIMEQVGTMVAGASAVARFDIVIPAEGWVNGPSGAVSDGDSEESGIETSEEPSGLRVDIPNEAITAAMVPFLTVLPAYGNIARECGLNTAARTLDGVLRVYAQHIPTAPMKASLTLVCPSDGTSGGGSGGGGYTLQPATATRLGAVKVGDGLSVSADGTLSVNKNTVMTEGDLVDEDEVKNSVADILKDEA